MSQTKVASRGVPEERERERNTTRTMTGDTRRTRTRITSVRTMAATEMLCVVRRLAGHADVMLVPFSLGKNWKRTAI